MLEFFDADLDPDPDPGGQKCITKFEEKKFVVLQPAWFSFEG
jgi:hypothetical protein